MAGGSPSFTLNALMPLSIIMPVGKLLLQKASLSDRSVLADSLTIRVSALNAASGSKLSLHVSHKVADRCCDILQRAAVRWMLQREQAGRWVADPCWRSFSTQEGQPFWGCSVTGAFATEPPDPIPDTRGGLFCDEPVSGSATHINLPKL